MIHQVLDIFRESIEFGSKSHWDFTVFNWEYHIFADNLVENIAILDSGVYFEVAE